MKTINYYKPIYTSILMAVALSVNSLHAAEMPAFSADTNSGLCEDIPDDGNYYEDAIETGWALLTAPENDDCIDAEPIDVATFPATAIYQGKLFQATNSGSPACSGSASGGDVFYSFTTTIENHVAVSVNPFAGADVVVQVLNGCNGSVISCIDGTGSGETENDILENLAPGTYIIRVHNSSGIPTTVGDADFLIHVQQFPLAKVQDDPGNSLFACNTSGRDLEEFIGASPQSGEIYLNGNYPIMDYQWLVAEEGGGTLYEWQRNEPNYSTRLDWLEMTYGTTYNVFVRVMIDHPVYGPRWGVYRGDYNNPHNVGASPCTINTSNSPTRPELLPNYTPTNVHGNDYALCDFAILSSVLSAENYRWRFDPDFNPNNGNEIFYIRGIGNPSARLSWVNGLQPGATYQVSAQAQVDGMWSGFGDSHPVSLAGVPNNMELNAASCNQTYAPSGVIVSQNVCFADWYQFRLTPQGGGVVRQKVSFSHVMLMGTFQPALDPGVYDVQVRIRQNGVLGDFGASCPITISGPTLPGDQPTAQRSENTGSATLFPNPNAGSEMRLELDGLDGGKHEVMIEIYNVYGQLIQSDGFGHEGTSLSRLVRFGNELPMGMYLVQVVVDGQRHAAERLIVK